MYTIEEFDREKTKVLKYILYKKRSEQEIRNKFSKTIDENLLEDIIEYLKEAGYINDDEYVLKTVNQICALKNLSIKEIRYKLLAKGISKDKIDDYMSENRKEMLEYEEKSASTVAYKKSSSMEKEEIKNYLIKKGYTSDSIKKALD